MRGLRYAAQELRDDSGQGVAEYAVAMMVLIFIVLSLYNMIVYLEGRPWVEKAVERASHAESLDVVQDLVLY